MDTIYQCKICKRYYTENEKECQYCKDRHIYISNMYADKLCEHFHFPKTKFKTFLNKYFDVHSDYDAIDRYRTNGNYFRIVASIFYLYSNMDKDFIVPARKIKGYLKTFGYRSSTTQKYIDLTFNLMIKKYRRFSPSKMSRKTKIERCIKKILGQMNKPVLFNHVANFIDLIGYDLPFTNPMVIAMTYILFYYQIVRNKMIMSNEFKNKANKKILQSAYHLYYQFFKKIMNKLIESDFEESKTIKNDLI